VPNATPCSWPRCTASRPCTAPGRWARLRDAHRALADALPQLNGPLIDDFSALQAFGATNPVLRGLFDSIFVVGGDGRLNLLWDDKGPRSPRTDLSDRPYFQVAMTEGRATVSDLFVGRVNSEPMVALAQPLVVQGRPVAVLVGGLMLLRRDIASVFTDASMDGQTRRSWSSPTPRGASCRIRSRVWSVRR
jgi:hypothetical protein